MTFIYINFCRFVVIHLPGTPAVPHVRGLPGKKNSLLGMAAARSQKSAIRHDFFHFLQWSLAQNLNVNYFTFFDLKKNFTFFLNFKIQKSKKLAKKNQKNPLSVETMF